MPVALCCVVYVMPVGHACEEGPGILCQWVEPEAIDDKSEYLFVPVRIPSV